MKAEDTVMNEIETDKVLGFLTVKDGRGFVVTIDMIKKLKEAQAEISSKAGEEVGYRRGMTESAELAEIAVYSGKQAGIREVVNDFTIAVASSTRATEQMEIVTALLRKYDSKLKEWGVKSNG